MFYTFDRIHVCRHFDFLAFSALVQEDASLLSENSPIHPMHDIIAASKMAEATSKFS
jgi:hypothetical protein